MAGNEKAAWVSRVLGLEVDAAPAGGPPLAAVWRDAKEEVDAGIGQLQAAMRRHPMPALARIADAGLNGITTKESVGMMAAMLDADRAGNQAAARKAVAAFRGFVSGDVAAAIDENPLGVDVGLRRIFGAALTAIEARLGA